eukprot:CAMPEP_0202112696 /NCGR_PEP_ID=MMETSP0965-20130614/32185_1 /ASSEMBLY_ACC=CAM_ASM_000507 /TAXON_ID=4773 /ORGANISM="Schizochytrium aggregatum, Strain ATCC28209" /LENGTH=42 /DNA_ID= /DNA_START= /DNA_END= /DNA_ORIENTATION=
MACALAAVASVTTCAARELASSAAISATARFFRSPSRFRMIR